MIAFGRTRTLVTGGLVVALAMAGAVFAMPAIAADDSSKVTVAASAYDSDAEHSPFPDLKVTVSQTKDLQPQGIQVSWTGGSDSVVPNSGSGGQDFVQIVQCWGDDPDHPGRPDRTTCQYGGFGTPGATRDSFRSEGSVAAADTKYTRPGTGFATPTYTSIPFRSATGVTVASVVDNKKTDVDVNTNQFFTRLTTNEVSWAGSSADGTGSAKFEVQTAAQSPGLGCGATVTGTDGVVTGAPCWLVIIPRGKRDAGEQSIINSGLFWDAWKHHVAVRLDFKPIGVRCAIGAAERQLAGSELASIAVNSWQPTLCGAAKGAAYTLINLPEADALASANGTATQPLALTSRPLGDGQKDVMSYAPIALTGLAITFAIDHAPSAGPDVPPEETKKARLPFTSMNLTPRLIAKLLTNSYIDSLPAYANKTHIGYKSLAEPGPNARNLTTDPDFLAVNEPEWKYEALTSPSIGDLLLPQGRSDAAWALWSYVFADKDAADFLAGKADPWGMKVNPWSATDATLNLSGTALQLPRDNFPKADPVEQAAIPGGAGPVNLVTWRPYTNDLDTSAYLTLRGDGQILGAWDLTATPPKYGKESRKLVGLQSVLGVSDTASAGKYQVVTASLLNPAGRFVAPAAGSLSAAAQAMTPDIAQSQVVSFIPGSTAAKAAPDAYPLAMPVYAATNPAQKDASLRGDYAAFIKYAVTDGQVPGTGFGELPVGYAPIPSAWKTQALAAAAAIASGSVALPTSSVGGATRTTTSSSSSSIGDTSAAPQPSPTPTASGEIAGALAGSETPADPNSGLIGAVVPLVIVAIIIAAIAAPMISRRRRLP